MVTNTLTDKLINGGKDLIEELDASGIKVDGALWLYFPEEGFWKLILSFPDIEKIGPKSSYTKVQKALPKLKEKDSLSLDDVAISKTNAPLMQLLKIAIRTGPGISGIRFSNNVINGQLIADAYIYRLI
jgi:hypothetical protein